MNRTPCLYLFPEDSAHSSLDSASSIEFLHDQASCLLKSFINRLLSSTREAEEEIVSIRKHLTTPLSPHKETTNNSKEIFFHFFPLVNQVCTSSSSSSRFAVCLPLCSIQKIKLLHATTSRLYCHHFKPRKQERKKTKIENSFLLQCSCKFASKKAPKNHRSFML